MLKAAIAAVGGLGKPRFGTMTTTTPPLVRTSLLIKRIRSRRAEFEGAWRLGAGHETLCDILGWNHQEKRLSP